MKRDLNLMRQIMLDLENNDDYYTDLNSLYPNSNKEFLICAAYHLRLLEDAGYIQLGKPTMMGGWVDYPVNLITNQGYEFIRLTQEPTIWEKSLPLIMKGGGIASIQVIQDILKKIMNLANA